MRMYLQLQWEAGRGVVVDGVCCAAGVAVGGCISLKSRRENWSTISLFSRSLRNTTLIGDGGGAGGSEDLGVPLL